jgi:hypothetical protein
MFERRPRRQVQDAVDDLRDLVLRSIQDVFVRRATPAVLPVCHIVKSSMHRHDDDDAIVVERRSTTNHPGQDRTAVVS